MDQQDTAQESTDSKVVAVDTERLDPVESEVPAEPEVAPEEAPLIEKEPEAEVVAPPEPEQKESHDVRRMKKFMQRAFEAEAKLAALQNQPANNASQEPVDPNDINQITARVAAQVRQEMQQQKAVENFTAQAELVKKDIPDYDEVIQESTVVFAPATQEVVLSSPYAARLAYELVKDDEYAAKVASMPPHLAAREIGKLEAKIEAEMSSKKTIAAVVKPVSKAPAPIKPLAPKATSAEPNPAKMNDSEWLAWRKRQKYGLK